ncbi:MAG: AMIN domain-containing protein [Gammaproteobacteria bacterium]|nr:MAG: AMIN domain-containing protein [Gammaproteobacteria bacterium]
MVVSTPVFSASKKSVSGIRLWSAPDNTRVVLDISKPVEHKIFRLSGPDRVVIDLKDTSVNKKILKNSMLKKGVLKGVRGAVRNKKNYRLVLDLSEKVKIKSFLVKPNEKYGHRLVVDLQTSQKVKKTEPVKTAKKAVAKQRDFVVVIDPGHGGEDPGAVGPSRVYEKKVVLAVGKKLAAQINKQPGMKAYLTRKGDYYLPLRKRMNIARKYQADMFISLHADAFRDKRVNGASVYTLSNRGASTEAAKWLAKKENASDLVGGVSIDDKDDMLASVLLDLSQSATLDASTDLARNVFKEIKKVSKLHTKKVEKAGFVVLKSPDIPSILVELGYISNPREERSLNSSKHQFKLAKAITSGVKRYYKKTGIARVKQYGEQYVVARGDTISSIAKRYKVSTSDIKRANSLKGDRLRVGDALFIPAGS